MTNHPYTGLLYRKYDIRNAWRSVQTEQYERPISNGDEAAAKRKLDREIAQWSSASGFAWKLVEEVVHSPWGDGEPTGATWFRFQAGQTRPLWKMTDVPYAASDESAEILWDLILAEHPEAKIVIGSSNFPSHAEPFKADKTIPYPTRRAEENA